MLIVSLAYLLVIAALWRLEAIRQAGAKPDLLCVFIALFALQLLIPGAVLTAAIALGGNDLSTGVPFFDRVMRDITAIECALALVLSIFFVISLYITYIAVMRSSSPQGTAEANPIVDIQVSKTRWILVMLAGLTGMWTLIEALGGGLIGFQNLILFRADLVEKTTLTANLFSQTQTFAMLSVVGVVMFSRTRNRFGLVFALLCLFVFALMGVSRRAFAIPLLLIYFTFVLEHGRFYVFRFLVPFFVVFAPVIMYGKELLSYLGGSAEFTVEGFDISLDGVSAVARIASNVGTSLIESWATLLYLDIPFRFGVDHLLSAARRVPEGFIGVDIDFPERMVRISTDAFVGPEQDIPPGLIGQMWLDFGPLGPLFWGILLGVQVGFLQLLFNKVSKTREAIAVFAIMLFVVALPLNSGSYDFVASVDIFLLFFLLLFLLKAAPRPVLKERPGRLVAS